jgi:hypothetical protein
MPTPLECQFHHIHIFSSDVSATERWLIDGFGAELIDRQDSRGVPTTRLRLGGAQILVRIDQAGCEYVAQRAVGAGFQGVMLTDCRSAQEARHYVRIVRPETPADGGLFGAAPRRFTPRSQVGGAEYLQALRDVVVILMIEKREAVEHLEEILPETRAVERRVIEAAIRRGIPPRAEIVTPGDAKYYLELGVRHFNLNVDLWILLNWWTVNGKTLREALVPRRQDSTRPALDGWPSRCPILVESCRPAVKSGRPIRGWCGRLRSGRRGPPGLRRPARHRGRGPGRRCGSAPPGRGCSGRGRRPRWVRPFPSPDRR